VRSNVFALASNLGGFLGTAYLVMNTLLGSFLSFSFDKSLMERLYYEEATDEDTNNIDPLTGEKRSDEDELVHRLNNRRSYNFGYWGYLMTLIAANLCCCFKTYCCTSYERRL